MLPDVPIPLRVFLPAVAWAIPVLSVLWFRYQRVPCHLMAPLIVMALGMTVIVGGLFIQSFVLMGGDDAIIWLLAAIVNIGILVVITLRVEGKADTTNVM